VLRRIRRLPSPALVISVIALTAAIGGGAFAIAASDNKKDKKIAKKVANKQIKKKAPGLSVLHAQTADTATTATTADTATTATTANSAKNADNATTTDAVTSFTYSASNGSTDKVVLQNFHGLSLLASCTSGANNGLTVKAKSTVNGADIGYESTSQGGTGGTATGTVHNDSTQIGSTPNAIMSPTAFVSTTNGTVGIGFASGQIVYSQPNGGSRVSVAWTYTGGPGSPGGRDCYWTGTATGTDNGPADVSKGRASKAHASSRSSEQLQRRRAR